MGQRGNFIKTPEQRADALASPFGEPGFTTRVAARKKTNGWERDPRNAAPSRGYMVSDKGPERIIPGNASAKEIEIHQMDNRDALLSDENVFHGGWKSDGNSYLDVSRHYRTKNRAMRAGRRNEQLAIFDLSTKESIPVTPRRKLFGG